MTDSSEIDQQEEITNFLPVGLAGRLCIKNGRSVSRYKSRHLFGLAGIRAYSGGCVCTLFRMAPCNFNSLLLMRVVSHCPTSILPKRFCGNLLNTIVVRVLLSN